jgi:hypothetical protein
MKLIDFNSRRRLYLMDFTVLTLRRWFANTAACWFAVAVGWAQIDRHPELQTRALAWTEYDGSYLLDVNSRADALDFYWTVMAKPYPPVGWTGSLATQTAGACSELWRVREYSQQTAYRALLNLRPVKEDASRLTDEQSGALVLALNGKISHFIDSTWIGYSPTAADSLINSLLIGPSIDPTKPLHGMADYFISDGGANNYAQVGHRDILLNPEQTYNALGAAVGTIGTFATWGADSAHHTGANAVMSFVAWPAPGFMPKAFLRVESTTFRWSFTPSTTISEYDFSGAAVTALIDGRPVTPTNYVNALPWALTWEFPASDLNFAKPGENVVTIIVSNAIVRGQRVTYSYTVTLFDEAQNIPVGFNPTTPLKNISTRGVVGSGDGVMIAGFVVGGPLPLRVALRAQGPSLTRFGLNSIAQKLRLTVFDNVTGTKFGENLGWRQHQDWRLLEGLGVSPIRDDEPGMVLTLWPGSYSAILSDDANANGLGVVEVFNIDNITTGRLANLSTRGYVSTNENALIAGLMVANTERTFVIRTQGPTLTKFGVNGVVNDTTLRLVSSDGITIATSDDWRTTPEAARLKTDLATYAPRDDREAALVLRLAPGAYTAVVEAKGGSGVGIVEIFDIE